MQALHAAETAPVPKSVLKRLRTQAGRATSIAKTGVAPFLACSVGSAQCVDPGYFLICSRVRLFRKLWRDFPRRRSALLGSLEGTGRYRSVTKCMLLQLRSLGWECDGLLCSDADGRHFHLADAPWSLFKELLLSSWMDHVASNLTHRKSCGELRTIDFHVAQVWTKYPFREQCLLFTQLTGATFTRDCQAEIRGSEVNKSCPLCGSPDSRVHRVRDCPQTASARHILLRYLDGRTLPEFTWAFGLWDIRRAFPDEWVCLFSDGSCIAPSNKQFRLSGGAVIRARNSMSYDVLWSGILPGIAHNSFRAELFSIAVAVGSIYKGSVCCGDKTVVRIAKSLLQRKLDDRPEWLPLDDRDLWLLFLRMSEEVQPGEIQVRWVKAHQDLGSPTGTARVLATFNGFVDQAAKEVVLAEARRPLYRSLFVEVTFRQEVAALMADCHVRVADLYGEVQAPGASLPEAATFGVLGWGICRPVLDDGAQVHDGFRRQLRQWLDGLLWYPRAVGGYQVTSALSLLWQFIFDTGQLPLLV